MSARLPYVDNAALYRDLTLWLDQVHAADASETERPAIPDSIGTAVWLIAQGIASTSKFRRHAMRDDLVAAGVLQALTVLDRFDPTKSTSAFSWITSVVYRAFLRAIATEDAHLYRTLQLARHLDDHLGWDCRDFLDDHAETIEIHRQKAQERREKTRARRGQA